MPRPRLKMLEADRGNRWAIMLQGPGRRYQHVGHCERQNDGSAWSVYRTIPNPSKVYVGSYYAASECAEKLRDHVLDRERTTDLGRGV